MEVIRDHVHNLWVLHINIGRPVKLTLRYEGDLEFQQEDYWWRSIAYRMINNSGLYYGHTTS